MIFRPFNITMFLIKTTNGAPCHGVKTNWVKSSTHYETRMDIEQSYMNDVVDFCCNLIFFGIFLFSTNLPYGSIETPEITARVEGLKSAYCRILEVACLEAT